MQNNPRGNALFLILIAVGLFAALAYAVSKSGRGSGSITREKDHLTASLLLQKAAWMQTEYDRFALSLGSPARVALGVAADEWTACSTGANCFWTEEGGGFSVSAFQEQIVSIGACEFAWCNFGLFHDQFNTPINILGTAAPDNYVAFYYLRVEICEEIRRIMGQETDLSVTPPDEGPITVWSSNGACGMGMVLTAF